MVPSTLQMRQQNSCLFVCVSMRVRMALGITEEISTLVLQEEIQHLNFKCKKVMSVYCYLSSEHEDMWVMTWRFFRFSLCCWHD